MTYEDGDEANGIGYGHARDRCAHCHTVKDAAQFCDRQREFDFENGQMNATCRTCVDKFEAEDDGLDWLDDEDDGTDVCSMCMQWKDESEFSPEEWKARGPICLSCVAYMEESSEDDGEPKAKICAKCIQIVYRPDFSEGGWAKDDPVCRVCERLNKVETAASTTTTTTRGGIGVTPSDATNTDLNSAGGEALQRRCVECHDYKYAFEFPGMDGKSTTCKRCLKSEEVNSEDNDDEESDPAPSAVNNTELNSVGGEATQRRCIECHDYKYTFEFPGMDGKSTTCKICVASEDSDYESDEDENSDYFQDETTAALQAQSEQDNRIFEDFYQARAAWARVDEEYNNAARATHSAQSSADRFAPDPTFIHPPEEQYGIESHICPSCGEHKGLRFRYCYPCYDRAGGIFNQKKCVGCSSLKFRADYSPDAWDAGEPMMCLRCVRHRYPESAAATNTPITPSHIGRYPNARSAHRERSDHNPGYWTRPPERRMCYSCHERLTEERYSTMEWALGPPSLCWTCTNENERRELAQNPELWSQPLPVDPCMRGVPLHMLETTCQGCRLSGICCQYAGGDVFCMACEESRTDEERFRSLWVDFMQMEREPYLQETISERLRLLPWRTLVDVFESPIQKCMTDEEFETMYEHEGCVRIFGTSVLCASLSDPSNEPLLCAICLDDLSLQEDRPRPKSLGIGLFSYAVALFLEQYWNGAATCFRLDECDHSFHPKCIATHLLQYMQEQCPVCRANISVDETLADVDPNFLGGVQVGNR